MLIKNINREHLVKPGEVCVFELDVINEGDQLVVIQKDNCSQKLFYSNEENIARIILIRSDSIPVIEAKLAVYRNYKHLIIQRNIWLQHEYEEFDEVAKLIAYERLSSICVSIELLINVFTIGLSRINSEPIGKQSTTEDIKTVCNKTFNIAKDEAVGLVNCNFYQKGEWGDMIAQFIHEKFYVNGEPEIADVLNEIKKICQKTVDDLNNILRGLEDFLLKVQPEDQSKVIEEWCKREVIQAGPALQKYPSIIQFIAGHTKDGQIVVKVYLRNDDKEAESYFKNGSKMLKDTKFEFVCVNKNSKAILKEVEKITHHEKRAPAIDRSTLAKLGNVIQEEGIKIYAQYSNVIGIGISQVRCVGDMIINEPCIVLYCLDKNIIPFGEKPLPESIAGWPCDIREDFVMFGKCPRPCPSPSLNFPESGCSIGIPSVDSAGSVGFLVESKNPIYKMQCGFLTASHVAIDGFEVLYHHKSLLSMNHLLSTREHCIVHPSWLDSGNIDFRIGKVVESFIGNYGSNKRGLDFALVKNHICRQEEKDTLPVADDRQLFDGMSVIKTGRTTGTTVGVLKNNTLSVRVNKSFLSRGYFAFFNCYAIENTSNEIFFSEGDSGSGVFVKESDGALKPLGIAFAFLNSQTAVCRIDEIVKSLDLTIVKYRTSP
uniref:Uncharacterized protein n=1 Tax=Magallana gigas TaxID=29159 RepID=A0A8W8NLM9_MAGGI